MKCKTRTNTKTYKDEHGLIMKRKTRTNTKTYQRGGGGKTGRGETHVQSPRVPEVRRCEVFKINMIGMFKMFKINMIGMEAVMDIKMVLIMAVMSIVMTLTICSI